MSVVYNTTVKALTWYVRETAADVKRMVLADREYVTDTVSKFTGSAGYVVLGASAATTSGLTAISDNSGTILMRWNTTGASGRIHRHQPPSSLCHQARFNFVP
jgi:hypothetical protein